LILTGVFWLYFWIFQFYVSYLLYPRWAHNFAYPLFLIIVGLAYKAQKTSTDLLAAISSFTIIPTEAGIITGLQSTYVALSALAILLGLLAVERGRNRELLFFQHRWRRWYKKHLLTFAYLFLLHIAFIFFFVRVFFGDLMQAALPPEPPWQPVHWSTASFNILVIPLGLMGMAERFRGTLRRKIGASKLGYWWSLGVIVVGIVTLQVTSKAWPRYLAPLVAVIAVLIISIVAYRRALEVD